MEDAGDARGGVIVVGRAETAEELSRLSTRELAARKVACDGVVDGRVRGFFEALNSWLVETAPELKELKELGGVVGVQSWELLVTGVVRCNCSMVGSGCGPRRTALITALGRCGFDGMIFGAGGETITLSIGADMLDKGFVVPAATGDGGVGEVVGAMRARVGDTD